MQDGITYIFFNRQMEDTFKIKQIDPDAYPEIERIFEAQGLENHKTGVEILKGYSVEASDQLIGGAEVILQDGEFTFSVAVNDNYKNRGIGKSLFQIVEKDIRHFGARRIMIQAKVPGYWSKFGFVEISPEDAPPNFRCDNCPKYQKECFPRIMVLNFK